MNARLLRLASGFKAWLFNWRSHALTLLLVACVALGINAWQTRHIPSGPSPDFRVELAGAIGAQSISLDAWRAQHAGRAVALHFWADWCPICRAEEDSVNDVQQDWPVLTVAMRSGDASQVARVLRQRQLPWLAAVDADGSLSALYGLKAVPAFIVLDAQGRIRHASVGYTTGFGMRARLWLAQHL